MVYIFRNTNKKIEIIYNFISRHKPTLTSTNYTQIHMYRTKDTSSGIKFPADLSFSFETPETKGERTKEVKLDYKFSNGEHDINLKNVEVFTNSRLYAGDSQPYSLTFKLSSDERNNNAMIKIKMVEHFVKSEYKQRSSKEWKGERWFDGDVEDEGFISKLKKYEWHSAITTTMKATIPINDDNTWDCNISDTESTHIFQNNKVDLPLFDETFSRNTKFNCLIHLKSIFLVDKIGFSRPSKPEYRMCVCNWEIKNIVILPKKTWCFGSINLDSFGSIDNSVSLDDSDDEE